MRKLLAYLITLFAVMACAPNLESDISGEWDPSLEGKPVTFTFSVPDVRVATATKGVDGNDGLISGDPYLDPDKLYLIVCGDTQSIKYIRKAEIIKDEHGNPVVETVPVSQIEDYPLTEGVKTVTMYKFKVQLELTDSYRTVYFLGNIDENKLITGSYAYQILPTLQSYENKQAYWQRVNMPPVHAELDSQGKPKMENGSYLPSEKAAASLMQVPLIRNYAKIQVTDATAPEDGFELYSYAVIYYPKHGSVAPFRNNVGNIDAFNFNVRGDSYRFSGYERCSFMNLDEDLEYPGYLSPNVDFDKTIPEASMFEHPENSGGRVIKYEKEDSSDQGFCLYERSVPYGNLKPTFVIIRGKFGDGEYYYYRLDLMETKIVDNESVYQYYPIYRNFRYNIQLNRISSIGVSTPEAAANSSGAEDISADISMKHLADISNGQTRLVVEPFMSKTFTGPNEEGLYYIYARFFNDIHSSEPNTSWGAVLVELEPMEDQSEDILILYDDVGNEVHSFYPAAQTMGGEPGFRVIGFNTKAAGSRTKTQKIKIIGRNLNAHEEFPLYREVEITLQKKQSMTVTCVDPLAYEKGASQVVKVTIPAGLPESMFPLDFTIEAESLTLTPNNQFTDNNLPVHSGISISDDEKYAGKQTIQFIRTLTLDEYQSLHVTDGKVSFSSYFKSNTSSSATTVWVANDYFDKGHISFTNASSYTGHFYVQADDVKPNGCIVVIDQDNLEYNYDEEGWKTYVKNSQIEIPRGIRVSFRSTANATVKGWSGDKFFCYSPGSEKTARDGKFSVGGNIASLIVGDDFEALGSVLNNGWSFQNLFKNHGSLTDASELFLPMLTCQENCYKNMFSGCASLTGIPQLPATTLASSCYESMFEGCANLVELPDDFNLPAGSLAANCYKAMFKSCTALITLPDLPATTLASSCYESMFEGCSDLAILPEDYSLPARNLATSCYKAMFKNSGLTSVPVLNATTLAESCYYAMFSGCTSLSTSSGPVFLPASTLVVSCYREMFKGASGVNEVICLAKDISASNCRTEWLKDVAATGTFWKASGVVWGTGVGAIPSGWITKEYTTPIFPNPPFDEGEIDL